LQQLGDSRFSCGDVTGQAEKEHEEKFNENLSGRFQTSIFKPTLC
jgi:hypothetical protein